MHPSLCSMPCDGVQGTHRTPWPVGGKQATDQYPPGTRGVCNSSGLGRRAHCSRTSRNSMAPSRGHALAGASASSAPSYASIGKPCVYLRTTWRATSALLGAGSDSQFAAGTASKLARRPCWMLRGAQSRVSAGGDRGGLPWQRADAVSTGLRIHKLQPEDVALQAHARRRWAGLLRLAAPRRSGLLGAPQSSAGIC